MCCSLASEDKAMKPVWKMGKGEAAKWMVIWAAFGVGCLLIDASDLLLVALTFLLSAAIFGWRIRYLINRDNKAAQFSRMEYVYHDHPQADEPTPPANKLYIPRSPQNR